ncbi:MAG: peptidase S9 family protein [Bacteroidetes bacterium]|nr:MAG: peptidase S9 family protein [Bacteroidota bacterium]
MRFQLFSKETFPPLFASIILCFLLTSVSAQKKDLSDEQMLKGKPTNITQPLPMVLGWVDDSHFLISKKSNTDTVNQTYLVDCKTGNETVSTTDALKKPESGPDRTVYLKGMDLFFKDGDKPEERLTNDSVREYTPTLSPDKNYVAFTKEHNLYVINLNTKKENKITSDGSDVILNGYASWVYTEEILGRASQYRAFWWSPDSKTLAFFRSDDSRVPVFTITSEVGQHGAIDEERYPKPGDPNPEVKVGIVSADGGNVTWANFNEHDDQYFGQPYWRPDGQALWVQWLNRGQDNLIIYEVDLKNGSKKEVYNEKQKTWVDLDDGSRRIKFLKDGKRFILQSDQTGWNMLYLYDITGKLINQITSGKFTVTSVNQIDEQNQVVYFTCRKDNTARYDLYKVKFNGTGLQRLTFGEYTHQTNISPNGSYFITTYSNTAEPAKMSLVDNKGKVVKEFADSKGPDFNTYNIAKTELVRVKTEDGLYDLPMKITWPLNMEAGKKYPVLINIYGGPGAGTVYDGWSFNGQQQWWAKEGLIVVSMDHRASGHFGKEGINYMHRNLGYWEIKDWSQCVKWLIDHGADKEKVCISGFSYGGYMTCYALTYGSDYFTYGLAGGSVVDWSLYDSHYTEKYMDTPKENPEGYKSSSVLNYIDKYKGLLRIYHGTSDDNVHLQNSLQLVKKLEEAKKHFEFMVYPGGKHGWGGNQSMHSTNENNLFIYRNLLGKEMPKIMWR